MKNEETDQEYSNLFKSHFDMLLKLSEDKIILGDNSYYDIVNNKYLNLTKIKRYQINNLKYIKENSIITFNSDVMYLGLMFEVIEQLQNIENSPAKIIINVNNKKLLNEYLIKSQKLNTDKVVISLNKEKLEEIPLSKYVQVERKLDDIIKPILTSSPFEQFLYVYNFVAQFKEYKESLNDPNCSKSIYKIFDSDCIICIGFVELLKELLDRLKIESKEIDVDVDTSLDNVNLDSKIYPNGHNTVRNGHKRLIVNLIDSKYNINGYYVSDPTCDNSIEKKYYLYSLMAAKEVVGNRRYSFYEIDDCIELFYSQNIEEFYAKIELYLKRNKYFINEYYQMLLIILNNALYDENLKQDIFKITGYIDLRNPSKFTKDEIKKIFKVANPNNLNIYNIIDDLFTMHNEEYFYKKELRNINELLQDLIYDIIEIIKNLDNEFYLKILEKFNKIEDEDYDYTIEEINKIILYIGNNIVTKSNNLIIPKQFCDALKYLFKEVYKIENYDEYVDEVVEYNNKMYKIKFPYVDLKEKEI